MFVVLHCTHFFPDRNLRHFVTNFRRGLKGYPHGKLPHRSVLTRKSGVFPGKGKNKSHISSVSIRFARTCLLQRKDPA